MIINYGEMYKNSSKKLKKRHKESETLEMIINHIRQCTDFSELNIHPISLMYEFEPLKYEMNGYYSFNVNKKGGKIRLILSFDSLCEARLVFVSTEHYEDFKKILRMW